MLIDWDNLQICHSRDAPGTELDLQALIALAQSYGTLVSARAYAEWNLLSERLAVYKAGIEPVFAPVMRPEGSPREGKSLADTVMVADGVDLLWTVAPDVFVLATSDKDMIPLARIAKQRGAAVVVLGSDLTAIPLVEMSNVFITYRQLLRELDRVSELEAPVGRAPARERRLRESRRPSSEPYSGGLGSGSVGAGPIGVGSRASGRPVGIAAPVAMPAPVAPSRPPRRRPDELVPPADAERTVPAPTPVAPAPFLADAPSEEIGSGGDASPRRRRRRGGRGRRSGLGSIGDGDVQTEGVTDVLDDSDEGDGTEVEQSAAATAPSPDDIDNAVLQLLASRDRPADSESVADETPSNAPSVPAFTAPAVEPVAPAAPRRVARTSFSSFGPPDVPLRPPSHSTTPPVDAAPPAEPASDRGDETGETSAPSAVQAASEAASVIQGLAPDAVVSETLPVEPIAAEPFPQVTPVAPDETEAVASGGAESTAPTTDESAAPARRSRSTRSGTARRTRRPAASTPDSNGTLAAASDAESASTEPASDSGDAARAPRRRRTRRPTASTSEPVSSEAGA
jgi:ribonuclease E